MEESGAGTLLVTAVAADAARSPFCLHSSHVPIA